MIGAILLTITTYLLSRFVYLKTGWSLLNPILLTILLTMGFLLAMNIEYEKYDEGGQYITGVLNLIVVLLAIPLYKNREKIKDHLVPIAAGIATGILTTLLSVIGLAYIFGLNQVMIDSLIAKSITTPLAIEVTNLSGGIKAITIVAVIITGITGASIAPYVMAFGRIKDDVAKGVGIGAASHGIGTAKALEISPEAAGASGLAMGITGVVTVLLASLLYG